MVVAVVVAVVAVVVGVVVVAVLATIVIQNIVTSWSLIEWVCNCEGV